MRPLHLYFQHPLSVFLIQAGAAGREPALFANIAGRGLQADPRMLGSQLWKTRIPFAATAKKIEPDKVINLNGVCLLTYKIYASYIKWTLPLPPFPPFSEWNFPLKSLPPI